MAVYKIMHEYDNKDRSIFIESKANPTDAAIYLQFKAEDLSGDNGICLSNLAIANALVSLYDCESGGIADDAIVINMHSAREERCGEWYGKRMNTTELIRDDKLILTYLEPHFGDQ